jgi:site-specific recombinase XerD
MKDVKTGKNKIHKILSICMNRGVRIKESIDQLNNQLYCLSCQNIMSTVKHNKVSEKYIDYKLSPNIFRDAHAISYFNKMVCIKCNLGHTSINMTSKYIKIESLA